MLSVVFNILSILCGIAGIGFLTWYALYAKKQNNDEWTSSYSATWSLWYKKLNDHHILWGMYLTMTCLMYIFPAYYFSTGTLQSILAILAIIGMYTMGVFPSGYSQQQTNIHCAGVQVSIWSTIIWVLLHGLSYWWILPIAAIPFVPYAVNLATKKIPEGLIVEWSAFCTAYLWLIVYACASF